MRLKPASRHVSLTDTDSHILSLVSIILDFYLTSYWLGIIAVTIECHLTGIFGWSFLNE
jgi:hypothetical protein